MELTMKWRAVMTTKAKTVKSLLTISGTIVPDCAAGHLSFLTHPDRRGIVDRGQGDYHDPCCDRFHHRYDVFSRHHQPIYPAAYPPWKSCLSVF